MMTLRQFSSQPESIPTAVSWYLADLGKAQGRQELFIKQSPQRLKVLREHALIESTVSSNRIEGVIIDQARVGTIVFGKPRLKDRNEEEVWGYRKALKWIHEKNVKIPISEETLQELHRLSRGEIWDAGKYKEKDGDIIEKFPNGREKVRFKTVAASKTSPAMCELIELWNRCLLEKWAHPLLAMAAFNLDFLCIHPFRDGNGRVSRLLLSLQSYHLGIEVGRYISLERLIEQNKERYYETLEMSSRKWHKEKHDPWPYIGHILYILKTAYKEFEERLVRVKSPRGEKSEIVMRAFDHAPETFRIADIQKECPGVSTDMIRKIMKKLRAEKRAECLGRGRDSQWRKTLKWKIGTT